MQTARTLSTACLPLVFLAALGLHAQSNPPFAGTWTRVEPPLAPDATHVEQIEVHGATLKIHREQRGSAGTLGYGFSGDRTYTIDGPPESKRDDDGRVRTVGVHREGSSLVVATTTIEGANATYEREVWTVSEDGGTLTKERLTTDWRGTRSDRTVFRRTAGKQE